MAFTKIQNRRKVESIVVADGNAALVAGGTTLNGTGGIVNLSDGQLGVFSSSTDGTVTINTALANGDSATDAPVIQIYQGTSNSATPADADQYPFEQRPYEASEKIYASGVTSWKGQSFRYPSAHAVLIGSATAASAINVVDESEYKIIIGYRGRRQDEFQSSVHGVNSFTASYTSLDYSALSLTSNLDSLVVNLANSVNKTSRAFSSGTGAYGGHEPVIALALDLDGSGGAGSTLGSLDDPASPGGSFNVFIDANGVQRTFTNTARIAEAIRQAIANLTDLTTSTRVVNYRVSTAGSAATADGILLITLPELPSGGEDRNEFLEIRIDVGLAGAFTDAVNSEVGARADEGEGSGRQWKIYFKDTAGQRKYSQNRYFYPVISYPAVSDIDDAGQYDAYIIEHSDNKHMSLDRVDVNAKKTIILVDPADTVTTASVEALMNSWMGSIGFNAVSL